MQCSAYSLITRKSYQDQKTQQSRFVFVAIWHLAYMSTGVEVE